MRIIIAVLSLLVLTGSTAFAAAMLSVSPKQVNVRSGPGTEYEVLWRAARYYPLRILDSSEGWLMVSDYENEEGWISQGMLAAVPAVVVVSEKANIREGAGLEYDVLWEVDKENSLKVLETDGNWYKVADGAGLEGWIHKSVTWGFARNPELENREVY